MRRLFSFLAVALLVAMGTATAQAQTSQEIEQALTWLRAQQQPDGGFSNGFAPGSDLGTTADTVLALVAAGQDPAAWSVGAATPLSYLDAAARNQPLPAGLAAKLTLAAIAAATDPAALGGLDLPAAIEGGLDGTIGLYGNGPYDSALALLALHAAGRPIPPQAAEGLLGYRLDDGSFSFNGDQTPGAGDSNTTALAVQALVAAGRTDDLSPSIAYFRATQNPDAGWTYQKPSAFGEATDANSTALVIQALLAAGEDLADWGDPAQALLALQLPSGAFSFNAATPSENLLATVQAVPALAGVALNDVAGLAKSGTSQTHDDRLDAQLIVGTLVALAALLIGMALIVRRRARGG
jgi:hypothetical protein